ncbi:cathepsin E-B-like [Amphibalanus amphitrite]|uniref:cathepsin E-B-like n=1 Tax=Amphibalanus amphitrite TaxID=1232801 RepID=UPI001C906007|nr:cathepsin E-B-like [Amphibalanus amphitrite]
MLRVLVVVASLGLLEAQTTEPVTTNVLIQPLDNIKTRGTQAFVGAIGVGTPPQMMPVTFDTTSDVSYVVSANCTAPVCAARPQYDAALSSTYQANGKPFELPFGQNVSGALSQDSVTVAGITVNNITFGEITSVWSDWYNNLPQSGVVGLGPADSVLDVLAAEGHIPGRQFGLWLGRDPAGGELTLGGLNGRRFSSTLTWAELLPTAKRQWTVTAEQVTFEGRPELGLCPDGCSVAPISTTPFFLLSNTNADAVNAMLGGTAFGAAGAVALDCRTLHKLPSITISVQGRAMPLSPLEYTFHLLFPNHMQMCISGFLGVSHLDDSTMMLGTLFMQKYYTAYDAENGLLGFADSV